jgi:peptide/nickel transport system substrate-binding protein
MHNRRTARFSFYQLLLLSLIIPLLAACEIEGGVPEPTPVTTSVPVEPTVLPTSATIAEQIAEREDTWAIGLGERPVDLYPYPESVAARRAAAPVTELLFPSPILALNYTYTTTGVLERIPSFENGDVVVSTTDVFLDAAGNITTTATQVMTQVEQLAITFRWNPDLRWSDGTPLTADDSVFAYEVARAAPPNNEARDLLAQTFRYEKVDDHTTRAILQPDYTGPTYFMSFWTPLPRHLLEDIPPIRLRASDYALAPVGYGPYMLEQRQPDELLLVRNPHYFGDPPDASRLVFRVLSGVDIMRANLLNGNLDVATTERLPPEEFPLLDRDASDGFQVIYTLNPIWEHIDFNLDVQALQDIRVRRAIALGTNRQAMIDTLYGGRVPILESWVLPGNDEAAPPDQLTRYPHDPAQARQLLDEAGYLLPEGGSVRSSGALTLTFQLMTTDGSPVRQAIAEQFVRDMADIGIEIDLFELSSAEMFGPDGPLSLRQFEMVLFGWIAGPEPGGLLLWSCGAVPSDANNWVGDNYAGWCFRDADRAMREADSTSDPEVRRAAYLQQQQLWTQEAPALPLFQRLTLTFAAPTVQGLQPDPLAPLTWNITSWERER